MGLKNSKPKKKVPDNQKAPIRGHTYEEIDEDQLAANQEGRDSQKSSDGGGATTKAPIGAKQSPTVIRLHPYEEVTADQLATNRQGERASLAKMGGASPRVTQNLDDDSTEYQNAAALQATSNTSLDNGLHTTENGDVYALPNKKSVKEQQLAKQPLNYIEVEFVPSPTKADAKVKPQAQTNYTNVINDNGKVVLLTGP